MLVTGWTRYNLHMWSAAPTYAVRWLDVADEELFTKVHAQDVARELIEVANTLLDDMNPPDGGQAPPLCWRRGITTQRRAELDAAEAAGVDLDNGNERAWDHVLVYRRDPKLRRILSLKTAYLIIGIVSNADVFAGLLDMDDLKGRTDM